MDTWRLIESPPASGPLNMAIDSLLLDTAAESGTCSLRFYSWAEPTVSLGYFQTAADRQSHAASSRCPLVRRATGGGAIIHDREITYSFVAPSTVRVASSAPALYRLIHEALIATLSEWGLVASMAVVPPNRHQRPLAQRAGDRASPSTAGEPFLCFQRRAEGDVLLGDDKIAGSAQRRRRGAVLQHGSVLLVRSAAAPELPGITDLGGASVEPDQLRVTWANKLAKQCGICWHKQALSSDEIKQAAGIVEETYSQPAWTLRR